MMYWIIQTQDKKVYLVKAANMQEALTKYKTRKDLNPALGNPVGVQYSNIGDVIM